MIPSKVQEGNYNDCKLFSTICNLSIVFASHQSSVRGTFLLYRQGPVRHTPVQYEVRTAWYNYTRRDGTTYAGILLSWNGTKTGRYMILACDVTPGVRSVVRGLLIPLK